MSEKLFQQGFLVGVPNLGFEVDAKTSVALERKLDNHDETQAG